MKKIVKINEGTIKRMVAEALKKVLNESLEDKLNKEVERLESKDKENKGNKEKIMVPKWMYDRLMANQKKIAEKGNVSEERRPREIGSGMWGFFDKKIYHLEKQLQIYAALKDLMPKFVNDVKKIFNEKGLDIEMAYSPSFMEEEYEDGIDMYFRVALAEGIDPSDIDDIVDVLENEIKNTSYFKTVYGKYIYDVDIRYRHQNNMMIIYVTLAG